MREIRLYGSEGGGAVCSPYPYPNEQAVPSHGRAAARPYQDIKGEALGWVRV